MRYSMLAGVSVLGLTTAALAGPDWVEQGDAGSDVNTAQVTVVSTGTLTTISGSLGGAFVADFEDCYLFRVITPGTFTAQTATASFNAQLFLFNISVNNGAFGLLANDDRAAGNNRPLFGNVSNDGTQVIVNLPGLYMLGITGFNRDPQSETGAMFNQASVTEVSGPDGPGGFNPLTGWAGSGESGTYSISFTGAGPATPAPGTVALLGLGGLVLGRRKR